MSKKQIIPQKNQPLSSQSLPAKKKIVPNQPNQQPNNLQQNQQLNNLPENQQLNNLPENQQPNNLPENQQPNNLPENQQPNNLPENQQPNNLPQNLPLGNHFQQAFQRGSKMYILLVQDQKNFYTNFLALKQDKMQEQTGGLQYWIDCNFENRNITQNQHSAITVHIDTMNNLRQQKIEAEREIIKWFNEMYVAIISGIIPAIIDQIIKGWTFSYLWFLPIFILIVCVIRDCCCKTNQNSSSSQNPTQNNLNIDPDINYNRMFTRGEQIYNSLIHGQQEYYLNYLRLKEEEMLIIFTNLQLWFNLNPQMQPNQHTYIQICLNILTGKRKGKISDLRFINLLRSRAFIAFLTTVSATTIHQIFNNPGGVSLLWIVPGAILVIWGYLEVKRWKDNNYQFQW